MNITVEVTCWSWASKRFLEENCAHKSIKVLWRSLKVFVREVIQGKEVSKNTETI